MNLIPPATEENSPYIQLLIIASYALIGLIIGSLLSIAVLYGMYGAEVFHNTEALTGGDPAFATGLKLSQLLTTVITFIAPPILLARAEKTRLTNFYEFKRPSASLLFLVLLIMVCSAPFVEWVGLVNQKMVLPGFLKPMESWMRGKEDEAMKMTILLLNIRNIGDFIINLIIIGLLPGIGEELLFRGAVQRSFYRMYHNPHVAIWFSAFIFSAIHLQFFGFFPRMFLGAMFGYIYLWTGSLWYAMFAHFLNNGYAVCQAWYLQLHHIPLDKADNTSNFPWYGYIISLILSIFLLKYLKDKTHHHHGEQLD
ncbi:CPBP family intramembrane glutamic endopeptidase [Pedobacter sp. L105]|uniref:CPBP family intramembrane glutamic endopeptidase n=1 Tax=Pedobacter sp. L105 TaxID=1641871 RepID=UPI00131E4C54|nr:CPBP family intramembrane glutamic endopeptidase [Pedobacter sp. L105]